MPDSGPRRSAPGTGATPFEIRRRRAPARDRRRPGAALPRHVRAGQDASPRHAHEQTEQLMAIVDGAVEMTIGDETRDARAPATSSCVNRGVEHELYSEGGVTFFEALAPVPLDHVPRPRARSRARADGGEHARRALSRSTARSRSSPARAAGSARPPSRWSSSAARRSRRFDLDSRLRRRARRRGRRDRLALGGRTRSPASSASSARSTCWCAARARPASRCTRSTCPTTSGGACSPSTATASSTSTARPRG